MNKRLLESKPKRIRITFLTIIVIFILANILFGLTWGYIHYQQYEWYAKNMASVFMILGIMNAAWIISILIILFCIGTVSRWR